MPSFAPENSAQVFGPRFLPAEALEHFLGGHTPTTAMAFDATVIEQAASEGCLLVYRPARFPDGRPLTLPALFERVGELAKAGVAFRGEHPWFLADPFAVGETPEEGWALVAREPWPETLNRTYEEAGLAITRRAQGRPWRRRRAVEAAFDTLAFAFASDLRPLSAHFDWTGTPSADGGWMNVGGFGAGVLDVVAYSPPVKHGWLGSCPTLVGA
jgi:hypothetical protein